MIHEKYENDAFVQIQKGRKENAKGTGIIDLHANFPTVTNFLDS